MAIRLEQADFLIRKAAEDYTPTGFFDDQSVKAMIIRTMNQEGGGDDDTTGLEYYNDLKAEFLPDLDDEQEGEPAPGTPVDIFDEDAEDPSSAAPPLAHHPSSRSTRLRAQVHVPARDTQDVVSSMRRRPACLPSQRQLPAATGSAG